MGTLPSSTETARKHGSAGGKEGNGVAQGGDSVSRVDASGILHLSAKDRAALDARAGRGIVRALAAQAIMGGLAALLSALVAGWPAGASALVGALAYFAPNALFALRLLLGLFGARRATPFAFFVGEAFKLGVTVLVLAVAAFVARDWLVWPAMLFGLVCVLKGYVLLLAARKLP